MIEIDCLHLRKMGLLCHKKLSFFLDGHVIQLLNENLNSGLSEDMILRIFTDVCEAVAMLHHSQPPVVHRDLKVTLECNCCDKGLKFEAMIHHWLFIAG